ncbi:Werner Syndrome-like exonuclease [Artemisia annua]|uniref:Werner Syndrome-like exonuclease n=1 Tax=Artemisia annua TaxID=35608 RepID=A0A2U1KBP8_ARTAN|nr:Werner Syndrome-like exonuclease [Artemisia annua]
MTSQLDVVLKTDSLPTLTLETTLTQDPKSVHTWITQTYQNIKANNSHQKAVVGIDTEWWKDGEVALLQLCFDTRVLVYQIIRSNFIPFSLIEFLNDGNLMFTGVNTKEDFVKLARYGLARGGKDNREYFLSKIKDLQDGPGIKNKSLAKLLEELSGYKIDKDKSVSSSN